jgi:hypothetical protein
MGNVLADNTIQSVNGFPQKAAGAPSAEPCMQHAPGLSLTGSEESNSADGI